MSMVSLPPSFESPGQRGEQEGGEIQHRADRAGNRQLPGFVAKICVCFVNPRP
jgi:hypothetical protein